MTANESSDVPVYLRLRAVLAASILEGNYTEGDQLPSVRSFAHEHGANPLTVAKAYQALQDDGYVAVKRGVGMFVAPDAIERLRVNERALFLEKVWPRMRAISNAWELMYMILSRTNPPSKTIAIPLYSVA